MNQVAVVIGGGQTLGEFLCAVWPPRATAWRWSISKVKKPAASPVRSTLNGEGTAYGFGADATSEASVTALAHGVDEIFTRVDLRSTAPVSLRPPLLATSRWAILTTRCRSTRWVISSAPASSHG